MVQTNPTPFEVGRAFVHQYYTLLHRAPGLLHRFYSTDSTFVHGGVDRPGSVEQPAVGPENISKRINELNLRDCHAKIRQVDSHPTIGNGVVVQVTGELSNNGDPMRRFMQTFVLAPREPKKYYVQNDIFRYQDEVFDDGSDEDDRSSSQVYNDTDKVSNADSSSVMPMQPTMVEVQHQALPPRRAPEAPAPVELPPVNTFQNEGPATSETTSNANQTSKNANAEGASYAGIAAKLAAGAAPVAPPVAPAPTTVTPPSTVKSAPINRGNPSQRGTSEGYYRTNHRAYMGSESSDGPYRSSYSAVNQISAPNEQQVFVGSLPPNITREDLMKCFSQFGNVIDARINVFPNETRKSYGFVAFDDAATASMVVQKQHVLYGHHQLNVEQKTQKSYPNSTNNTGNMRHNYPSRGGRGMMSRGGYKNNPGGNPRRGGPAGGGQGYRQENFDENHPKIVNQS